MQTPTQEQIAVALESNQTNLCAWATSRDYKYRTVFTTLTRWGGRNDRTPHGGIARQIMKELAEYVANSDVQAGENL